MADLEEIKTTGDTCVWIYDNDDNCYNMSCPGSFYFAEGGVAENDFVYCPYCGKKIEEIEE